MTVETPDYLIGIGGGGCSVVESIMERDWVIYDVVKQLAEGNDTQLHARTIDSATSDSERGRRGNAEERIINNITHHMEEAGMDVQNNLDLDEYSDIDFKHYNYVEDTRSDLTTTRVLTRGIDVRSEFLSATNRLGNNWWLKDHSDLLTDGFGNGVVRRRALSKALYHVSAAGSTTNNHPADLGVSNDDQVVMVIALGGGTGSGSFIDLAVDMSPDANIHLFAIIPDAGIYDEGKNEPEDELASAYAALSELEFLQLSGESPFETVNLVPYLNRNDVDSTDFADAVAHTVLGHQKVIVDGNAENHLVPGRANALNDTVTFNVAVPRIVRYDAGMREQAREDVTNHFDEREAQLDVEHGLYIAVEDYLQENFEDSFGDNIGDQPLNPDNNEQARKLHSLSFRIEDQLQGGFLTDENLRVAGLGETVDDIVDEIEDIYESQFNGHSAGVRDPEDENEPVYERVQKVKREESEYAQTIATQVPEQLIQFLENEVQGYDGDDRRLVKLVLQELRNIRNRHKLLQGIYGVANEDIEGLSSSDVKNLKTALTDVVLDHTTRNLHSEFPKGEIKALEDEAESELAKAELQYAQLEQFENELTDEIQNILSEWYEREAADDFKIIEKYHKKYDTIEEELYKLNSVCEDKATDLSDETTPSTRVSTDLRTNDGAEIDIRSLNDDLKAVGLETGIDSDELEDNIQDVKNAKKHHQKYHDALLFKGEHERKFNRYKNRANRSDYFEVTTDIENSFNVEFTEDFESRLNDIEESYDDAAERISEKLEALLLNEHDLPEFASIEDLVDETAVVGMAEANGISDDPEGTFEEVGYLEFTVPERGDELESLVGEDGEIYETLKNLDVGEIAQSLELKQTLGLLEELTSEGRDIEPDDLEDPTHPVERFASLYLKPVWDKQDEIADDLATFGSGYREPTDGLYQALGRLVRIADNSYGSDVGDGIELVSTDDDYSYASDFYRDYNDSFNITVTERDKERSNNPLIRTRQAERMDLVDDPKEISGSNIWANREQDIINEFELSIADMAEGNYGRLPVDLGKLEAPDESNVPTNYRQLRVVNVFMSRAFDDENKSERTNGITEVGEYTQSDNTLLGPKLHESNGYLGRCVSDGDDWTLSLLTFVSGFTLDMLDPLTERNGYNDIYNRKHSEATYPWRNHNVGLGAEWNQWKTLAERVKDKLVEPQEEIDMQTYGGYLWRAHTDSPGKVCADILSIKDQDKDIEKEEIKEKLREYYEVDTFRSTVEE